MGDGQRRYTRLNNNYQFPVVVFRREAVGLSHHSWRMPHTGPFGRHMVALRSELARQ
jgi:hypothetical protein